MNTQPTWKFIVNLGGADPLEHDGYFVYQDETGGFEAERLTQQCDGSYQVHRILLERCKLERVVDDSGDESGGKRYLVPYTYQADWPNPVSDYREWFARELGHVASYVGSTKEELIKQLCSEDGPIRAEAYRAIGDYHGWENLDSYPITLTRAEVEARYKRGELG